MNSIVKPIPTFIRGNSPTPQLLLIPEASVVNTVVLLLLIMGGNVINAVEQLLFEISKPKVNRIRGQLDLMSLNLN